MPELDGWKVLEMARHTQPQPRIIIITAKGSADTGSIAKARGAWAFVEKPYVIDNVKKILKEFFNGENRFEAQSRLKPSLP
jgi:DNA-binding NtrC family response regulator